ncbi:NIPSNAP family protein [Rhodopila sp.]|uniref:NIPSNAP family protein n=1 Tax=Rhodopila sp. TaxID=2480087 RepID=UPI003D0E94E9
MICELTTIACPLLAIHEVADGARAWISGPLADGSLLGCWRTEIGTLGRLLVLRSFDTAEALAVERQRALLSDTPFNASSRVKSLSMESYAPFPFLPPPQIGARGPAYEFRTYQLKPGGLPPTLVGWQQAIAPARDYTERLVINMYALDGPPRITHIWGFRDLYQRSALRTAAYSSGVWPPRGGPDQIVEASSTIALPEPGSPLA